MTVENVTYISDLEPANPKGGDSIAQGDNHIRNTKLALRNTFPNIDGEVVTSDEELNLIQGLDRPITEIIQDGTDADDALAARVTKNEADIAGHGSRISKNESDIARIDANLSASSGSIAALQSQVNTNTQNISNNAAAISAKADKSYVDTQDQALSARITALESKGGAMIKLVAQPQTAGNFSLLVDDYPSSEFVQKYIVNMPANSTATYTLSVPNGMAFCLEGIQCVTDGVCRFQGGSIIVDGVDVNGGQTGTIEYNNSGGRKWPSSNSAPIKVSGSLQIQNVYASSAGSYRQLQVAGFFVEA